MRRRANQVSASAAPLKRDPFRCSRDFEVRVYDSHKKVECIASPPFVGHKFGFIGLE